MPIRIVRKRRRKPGARAGLTRARIIEVATRLWLKHGPDEFGLRALARALGVVPSTIAAHCKGGLPDILSGIARTMLDELAPPYKPAQQPTEYLEDLLHRTLMRAREHPAAWRFVVHQLSDDPLVSPVFAERLFATVAALVKEPERAKAFHRALEQVKALIVSEANDFALLAPEKAQQLVLGKVAALPASEFPNLKEEAEALAKHALKRAGPNYSARLVKQSLRYILQP